MLHHRNLNNNVRPEGKNVEIFKNVSFLGIFKNTMREPSPIISAWEANLTGYFSK